jgi:L-asparaginase / beta-aspartyl-peptidase
MRTTLPLALVGSLQLATALFGAEVPRPADRPYGLVIHGGAGSILPQNVPPAREAEYRAKLTEARDSGYKMLEQGGTALEAVISVITILEDSPLFNAGKGAVFNADGICELDASIMDGRTLAAGAVAGVRRIKNPITLARAVMEKSSHVMLTADGAETFARLQGFVLVENSYFHTPLRREEYERSRQLEARTAARRADAISIPQPGASLSAAGSGHSRPAAREDEAPG